MTPVAGGGFAVELAGRRVVVRSSFSFPNVGWNTLGEQRDPGSEAGWQPEATPLVQGSYTVRATGKAYRLERRVESRRDHVAIADKLTNLTDRDLHISLRHGVVTTGLLKPQVWVRGRPARLMDSNDSGGDNPTVFLQTGGQGFGVVAEDDVLRVQSSLVASPALQEAGLIDHHFMIAPREQYEIRWSVYPVPGGDYYDFVNAVRRNWDTNFTIPGPFAFPPHPRQGAGEVPDYKAWLDNGGMNYVSLMIPNPRPAVLAHGLAFLEERGEQQDLKAQADMLRSLKPGLKVLQYLHVYITRSDAAVDEYAEDRAMGPDGRQYEYSAGAWKPHFWLFVPTTTNAYGKAMNKTFDLVLDELGFDGVYWDEMAYSAHKELYRRRDGHSAFPDMATMTVQTPVAMMALECQGYQVQQARRVLDAGKVLIANGQPVTETMTRLHFPRFIEAWHPSSLRTAHLYCPVALSSPDRIRSEADLGTSIREHLENGGLWYYYLGWNRVRLTHPNPCAHMFPFTPIELHAGYLIGQERILTCRSGLFGWGDKSEHRAFVYDHQGRLQPDFAAPMRTIAGRTYTELRLPGGWIAAIERVP